MARHPSETEDYLLTRVLAYCLELTEGLTFFRGLAEPNEPARSVRDPLYAIDRGLLAALTDRLERRMAFELSIADRHLFVTIAGVTIDGAVERFTVVDSR